MGRLDLVGGGPGAVLALRRHFKAALDALKKEKPLVAYVGVASNDNPGFQKMLTTGLAFAGARFRPAKIAAKGASVAAARDLLLECDLVFVSGGDVEHGMNVLKDKGLLPFFRDLSKASKPMFGISAGSLMLGQEWVRFPDGDDLKAELFECIGAAPIHVDAHSEDDDWSELRTLVRLLHDRGDPSPVGYGLTSKGGVTVMVKGDETSVKAIGTDIPRLLVRSGKVTYGKPLPVEGNARRSP
jgi:peptidase E